MTITRILATPFAIPFRRPMRIAGTSIAARHGILLELADAEGRVGLGEIAPPPHSAAQEVAAIMRALAGGRWPADPLATRLRVGLETALLDLTAHATGVRVADLLGGAQRTHVRANALLDAGEPAAAALQARALVARGFRCLKLKLSPDDVACDAHRIAAVRAAVGDAIALRADANAAWMVNGAIAALRAFAPYDLEYVEQPAADIAGLAAVRRAVAVPLAADESVVDAASIERIAAAQAADVVVVKPAVLGLCAATAVARVARRRGLDVVVTSALDTSIGIAAAAQLAATLPEPLRPCGLATAELLAGDLVRTPLVADAGSLAIPAGPGLGIELDRDALRRWQSGDTVGANGVAAALVAAAFPRAGHVLPLFRVDR